MDSSRLPSSPPAKGTPVSSALVITTPSEVAQLHEQLFTNDVENTQRRVIIGIAGAPGVGKSTVAAALVESLCQVGKRAVLVPMDGFHLSNAELRRLGRHERKGAPDTFDVGGYAALLKRIRVDTGEPIWAPIFHREIEESIAAELVIEPQDRIIVTEGNYLLHNALGWEDVRSHLDHAWFLRATNELDRQSRLTDRHVAFGRNRDDASAWVANVDEPNAALIGSSMSRADLVIAISRWQ
jgi:pantothenate kinase